MILLAPALAGLPEIPDGPDVAAPPPFEEGRFRWECRRTCALVGDGRTWSLPADWMAVEYGDAFEIRPSAFRVTVSVDLGDATLVHLYAYAISDGGSMDAAGGVDLFVRLSGDRVERVLAPGAGGVTMWRLRGGDVWGLTQTFLVGDVDIDGRWDIGRIEERAHVRPEVVLRQEPVRWALGADGLVEGDAFAGVLPEHAREVPRTGLVWTASEYVMNRASDGPWNVDPSVVWNPPPRSER
ncbi:MAG: hypothetical protein H6737_09065 [Alphaproteobacteria bacterium]|nr:hypothetical protein [Alphaproteobacteria bacterium]